MPTDNTGNIEVELRERLESECIQILEGVIARLNRTHFDPATDSAVVKQHDELTDTLANILRWIVREGISADTEKFITHTNALKRINSKLLNTIGRLDKIAETLDTLGKFIGVVEELLNLATSVAGSGVSSRAATALDQRMTTFVSDDRTSHRLDPWVFEHVVDTPPPESSVVDGPPKSRPVAPTPVEEVLHGIELTDEKLIITVATGGCTEEDSFDVYVDKGYTKLPPYQVTVYRIKPDDCKGNFEPIRISFSRRKLGLEGNVDFRILNRIGNTSNHRLKP